MLKLGLWTWRKDYYLLRNCLLLLLLFLIHTYPDYIVWICSAGSSKAPTIISTNTSVPVYMQVCAGVSVFWISSQLLELESTRLMGLTCIWRCFQYKRAAGSWPLVGTCPAFHLQGHCQEHPVDLTVDEGDEQPKLSRAEKVLGAVTMLLCFCGRGSLCSKDVISSCLGAGWSFIPMAGPL